MDEILRAILAPSTSIIPLDEAFTTKDYDLCRTLGELGDRLDQRTDRTRPVFAYTQPQTIHVATITREGTSVPAGESYSGFYAPYASRLRRTDACFGQFVDRLQRQGLYDNSVIVFTSDHGDSLGEEGRWGHAYTLFPEIVRVPLLVHLPASSRQLTVDADAVTFLTDLTPSLYYLLGHGLTRNDPLFGHPLFTTSPQERADYQRDWQMLASSYGPVYGMLGDRGRSLYVVDATNYRDYAYRLGGLGGKDDRETLTPVLRQDRERLIRSTVDQINKIYKVPENR
jgi:arylsulfatase A-like enzyme